MSRNYKFHNPNGTYFATFAVVEWADVFSRAAYSDIFLDSIRYAQQNFGLKLHAWCIMSNHVHLIYNTSEYHPPEKVLGRVKQFSSNQIVKAIRSNPRESRKEWLLEIFERNGAKTSNVKRAQFWRHDNHPIEIWSRRIFEQKKNYIHQNPVKARIVEFPEEYLYSSARDYAGKQGLLDVVVR